MTAKLTKAVQFVVYNAAGLFHKTRNIRNHKYLCTKWQHSTPKTVFHSLLTSCEGASAQQISPKNAFTLETNGAQILYTVIKVRPKIKCIPFADPLTLPT